jgi:CRISPR-associated protein Cmr3
MFQHLVQITPLGLLYGSAGRFLSPDNLVGRSGTQFPPSAATFSGLVAAHFQGSKDSLYHLRVAGPFWAMADDPQNFYVRTPFNCQVEMDPDLDEGRSLRRGRITDQFQWNESAKSWQTASGDRPKGKGDRQSWISLADWQKLRDSDLADIQVYADPWTYVPHLHPKLMLDERRVVADDNGSLFLENAVQLHPDVCLIYLSSVDLSPAVGPAGAASGCYRFGGEGHVVDLRCVALADPARSLLAEDLGDRFALVTPAVWGSNRKSLRHPEAWIDKLTTLLCERPIPFRYRFAGERDKPKRLSIGRYAVPSGSVYVMKESLPNWSNWQQDWFPKEVVSLSRWGCGLALPL